MNQLETNLVVWAICSILLFELLITICVCRCFFNRIRPKRFYVKKEEYEYLQGSGIRLPQFQSTILRPPHADELALIGTIRSQNPMVTFDDGIENFGYSRDDNDIIPTISSLPPPPPPQRLDWIELRPPTSNHMLHTEYLPPAEYEIQSYPISNYVYTHQSPPPRPKITQFRSYPEEYDSHDGDSNIVEDYDEELENFRLQPFRRPEIHLPQVQRTDTSTESFGGNYSTTMPKSILKGSTNVTPPPLNLGSKSYSPEERDYPSPRYDQSPRVSVKINTDESILMDYPSSAVEKIIPIESIFSGGSLSPSSSPSLSLASLHRMRFASVSRLNDIEWEVPSEFQTVVYDLTDERPPLPAALLYSSNENLNRNNSNNNANSPQRQRSQSAAVDHSTFISRLFVPWTSPRRTHQSLPASDDNNAQQQALEY